MGITARTVLGAPQGVAECADPRLPALPSVRVSVRTGGDAANRAAAKLKELICEVVSARLTP